MYTKKDKSSILFLSVLIALLLAIAIPFAISLALFVSNSTVEDEIQFGGKITLDIVDDNDNFIGNDLIQITSPNTLLQQGSEITISSINIKAAQTNVPFVTRLKVSAFLDGATTSTQSVVDYFVNKMMPDTRHWGYYYDGYYYYIGYGNKNIFTMDTSAEDTESTSENVINGALYSPATSNRQLATIESTTLLSTVYASEEVVLPFSTEKSFTIQNINELPEVARNKNVKLQISVEGVQDFVVLSGYNVKPTIENIKQFLNDPIIVPEGDFIEYVLNEEGTGYLISTIDARQKVIFIPSEHNGEDGILPVMGLTQDFGTGKIDLNSLDAEQRVQFTIAMDNMITEFEPVAANFGIDIRLEGFTAESDWETTLRAGDYAVDQMYTLMQQVGENMTREELYNMYVLAIFDEVGGEMSVPVFQNDTYLVDVNSSYLASVDGILYDKNVTQMLSVPASYSREVFEVPNTVTVIDTNINKIEGLKHLVLEKNSSVTEITASLSDLESVVIPRGIKSLSLGILNYLDTYDTIYGSSVREVTFEPGSTLERIEPNAFTGVNMRGDLVLPNSLLYIDNNAFSNGGGYYAVINGKLVLPNSLRTIGNRAFYGVKINGELVLPSSLRSIGQEAFYYGSDYGSTFSTLTIESGSEPLSIGNSAFGGNSLLTTVTIPSRVNSIGQDVFKDDLLLLNIRNLSSVTLNNSHFGNVDAPSREIRTDNLEFQNKITIHNDGLILFDVKSLAPEENGSYLIGLNEDSIKLIVNEKVNNRNNYVLDLSSYNFKYIHEYFRITTDKYFDNNSSIIIINKLILPNTLVKFNDQPSGNYITIFRSLNEIEFGISIEYIGNGAFENSGTFEHLVIPNTVKHIGNRAFYNSSFKGLTLSNSLVSIGDSAFSGSSSGWSYSLFIPASVETIGEKAFEYYARSSSNGITSLTFESGSKLKTIDKQAFKNNRIRGVLNFPTGLNLIGADAFYDNMIEQITIPATVTTIGSGAFYASAADRNNVRQVRDYSGKITSANKSTYFKAGYPGELINDDTPFTNEIYTDVNGFEILRITSSSNPDEIGQHILGTTKTSFTNLDLSTIPNLKTIKNAAFKNKKITTVTIPASVEVIEEEAFYYSGIVQLTFASNSKLKTIGKNAFYRSNFSNSITITIPKSVEVIDERAFSYSQIKILNFESGSILNTININAFSNNDIKELVLPNGLLTIRQQAFEYNYNLQSITIPSTVTTIGSMAFGYYNYRILFVRNLSSVTLTSNHINVLPVGQEIKTDNSAFVNTLSAPDSNQISILNVTNLTGQDAKYNGRWLFASKEGGSVNLSSYTNIKGIFDESFKKATSVVFPQGVQFIGKRAFEDHEFTSLTVPASVKELFDYAFERNYSGSDDNYIVNFENGSLLEYIGEYAFYSFKLKTISLPNGVKYIGRGAFSGSQIESVVLPAELIELGNSVFYRNELTSVTFNSKLKIIGEEAFYGNKIISITLPSSLEEIKESAFYNNNLTSVEIPSGVKVIGQGAFANNNLSSVILNEGLLEISSYAFRYNRISQIVIPSTVNKIGYNILEGTPVDYIEFLGSAPTVDSGGLLSSSLKTSITIKVKSQYWQSFAAQVDYYWTGVEGMVVTWIDQNDNVLTR